jgi:RHS repeat-associated protein
VAGASVSGNDKVWNKFTFAPLTTSKIRVYVTNVAGDNRSQIVEIEAYNAGSASIQWLVSDHLGTPRMIIDQSGTLANVKRHDYLPFGEELFAPTGSRNPSLGYTGSDGVRQQFTLKERDNETGLDYFNARYYSSIQGRFTSVDPFMGSAKPGRPQSWNRYTYCLNNPLAFIDPTGLIWGRVTDKDGNQSGNPHWYADEAEMLAAGATSFTPENNIYRTDDGQFVHLNPNGPGSSPDRINWTFYNSFMNPFYTQGWEYISDPNAAREYSPEPGLETDWTAQLAIGGFMQAGMKLVGAGIDSIAESAIERRVTLFRGVGNDHPFFEDATNGTARPFGGHSDPLLHNQGNTFSEFTSWSTQRSVAVEATGGDGVVLQQMFRVSRLVRSPDLYGESEVLIRGVVTGAKVTKP